MAVSLVLAGQAPQFLTAPVYVLGRGSDCDVLLPEGDGLISRRHARLERDAGGAWWVVDTSTNGTFVNGDRITDKKRLSNGDHLGIGKTQFLFSAPGGTPSSAPAPVAPVVSARDLATVFTSKQELDARLQEATSPAPIARTEAPAAPVPPVVPVQQTPAPELPAPLVAPAVKEDSFSWTPEPATAPEAMWLHKEPPRVTLPFEESPKTEVVLPLIEAKDDIPALEAVLEAPAEREVSFKAEQTPFDALTVLSPKTSPSPASATGPMEPVAIQKQCSRCRTLYVGTEDGCPSCGYSGFKVRTDTSAPLDVQAAPNSLSPVPTASPVSPAPQFVPSSPQPQPAPAPSDPYPNPAPQQQVPQQQQRFQQQQMPPQPAIPHVVHHVVVNQKSAGTALLFSFFLVGGGQIYNGQAGKGVALFFGAVCLGLASLIPFIGWLFWLPWIGLWIYNMVDAHGTAERLNRQGAVPPSQM